MAHMMSALESVIHVQEKTGIAIANDLSESNGMYIIKTLK